ncbi:hypothetical protein KQI63_12465 [bacterium]|nr:hypothetical protein [bacterium]
MKSRRLLTTGLILTVGLLVGCVRLPRESLEVDRYSIDLPDSVWAADETLPITLYIPAFQSSAQQRGDRIFFRDGDRMMNFYFYHRWVVSPEQMIGDVLARDLERSGLFGGGVFQDETGMIPTHEIQGRLVELYADNTRGGYRAVLEIKLTVFRIDPVSYEKKTVFQKSYPFELERDNGYVKSFVDVINGLMASWLDEVHADLLPLFETEAVVEPPTQRPLPEVEVIPELPAEPATMDLPAPMPTKPDSTDSP